MPATASASLTGNAYIDSLLGDARWAVNDFTFSFPTSGAYYGAGYGYGESTNNFAALNGDQQAAARSAFAMFASVADLTFTGITETSSRHADLRLAMSDKPSTAWAYMPTTAAEGGDAWFNRAKGYYDDPVKGNYAFATFIHELGHALGLEHSHEGNVMPTDRDSMEYTVMSYNSYVGSTDGGYINENWGFAQSLMMYDIAALQHLYGANFTDNSGNTTYIWSPTTGEMFVNGIGQGAPGANRIFETVWDGGGSDTYDFSSYTTNLRVDLRPGQWTTTSTSQLARLHYDGSELAAGNIANALQYRGDSRSLIENAKGGSGHDTIIGNAAANHLQGLGGSDTLRAFDGNDVLIGGDGDDKFWGGTGADRLDGGNGIDYSFYDSAASAVRADLLFSNLNTGEAAGDTYVSIERLCGSKYNDNLRGDNAANVLYGIAGNDSVYGRGGNDILIGGDGGDKFWGGTGADRLDGGNGIDYAFYDSAVSAVRVDLLFPSLNTDEAAGDTYASIERFCGSKYNDDLRGDNAANVLYGIVGNDSLYGRGGNDILIGGDGDDKFWGGTGADRLDGGNGTDYAFYDSAESGVRADLLVHSVNTGEAVGDTYVSIERLCGSRYNDDLRGDNAANVLYGIAGNDNLYGRGGNDILIGGDGNDRLIGGTGADILLGGAGQDLFVYGSVKDSLPSAPDVVRDFESGIDHLDLRSIDANIDAPGDQAFDFIGSHEFTGHAGELNFSGGIASGDVDGDGKADFRVSLFDVPALVESDFFL